MIGCVIDPRKVAIINGDLYAVCTVYCIESNYVSLLKESEKVNNSPNIVTLICSEPAYMFNVGTGVKVDYEYLLVCILITWNLFQKQTFFACASGIPSPTISTQSKYVHKCIEVKQWPTWIHSLYDKFHWVGGWEKCLHSRLEHLIVRSYIVVNRMYAYDTEICVSGTTVTCQYVVCHF